MDKEKKTPLKFGKAFFWFFLAFMAAFLFFFILIGNYYLQKEEKEIFILTPSPVFTPSPPPAEITLMVTGDVMLARSLTTEMRRLKDFAYPFKKTAQILSQADLTLINLESPLGNDCVSVDTGMRFCADFRAVEGLIKAGVDLVSLANNHALDQGESGLRETIRLVEENFMTPLGLREPVFWESQGVRLAFLAYNAVNPKSDLISWADSEVVESEIKRFDLEADVLIVYFHWGKEYEKKPMAGSGTLIDPVKLAHLAIDSGADLVLGSHPHVIQENEWYQGKLIVYSLGNFIFDQSWSQETQEGLVGKFVLNRGGLVRADFLPVEIINYQPRFKK
ncbi:MAG: CapA family protein [Candidatus Pacebacteria bacterium]|nr:CapA family protein [Candidatus Paceibacterota bacterium]